MHTIKVCEKCSLSNPGSHLFCATCGASLRTAPAVPVPPRVAQTTLTLPDYLRKDYGQKRHYENDGGGSGLIWLGLLLVLIPALSSNISPVTLGAWGLGLLLAMAGFFGLRNNPQGVARVGVLTVVTSVLVLSTVAARAIAPSSDMTDFLFPFNSPGDSKQQMQTEPAVASGPLPGEVATGGEVAMDRGSPSHTGLHPGPGPTGNPYRSWRYDTGGPLKSTPVVADGIIYVGGFDGNLHAIDLATGKGKWTFPAGDNPILGAPAVQAGLVFVCSGFTLYAIDTDTGLERWRAGLNYVGEASPVIANDVIYVASRSNMLYAINIADGSQRWQFKSDSLLFAPPTIIDGKVLAGSDSGKLHALDEETGRQNWLLKLEGGIYSTTAASRGVVYVVTSDQTTHAIDLANGTPLWSWPAGGDTAPALSTDAVLVGSADGGLYALSIEDQGNPLWLAPLGSTVKPMSPVLAQQVVYAAAGQTLYAFELDNGDERWRYPLGDVATTSPVVVDGLVLIGARDGYLYAIAGDGSPPAAS